MKQLLIYASLFCLEYNVKPQDIKMELRLYQSDDIVTHTPESEEIVVVMNKIITSDRKIQQLKIGG